MVFAVITETHLQLSNVLLLIPKFAKKHLFLSNQLCIAFENEFQLMLQSQHVTSTAVITVHVSHSQMHRHPTNIPNFLQFYRKLFIAILFILQQISESFNFK